MSTPEAKPVSRSAAQTRAHVLEVAGDLFYWNGIRATGVDLVAAKAGVAPTTLYRLFPSKDDLVAAYVERADADTRQRLTAAVAAAGPHPREQILALFDNMYQQIDSGQFRGCAMMMTLAEFPDSELTAHRNAVAGKVWFRDLIGELTERLGVDDSAALANQLVLVAEGLLASGQSLGPGGPAKHARRLAETILSTAARGSHAS
ncbi:MAG TPA: TetR/AcrR family transcriptional regulator [Chloroflexota bacterium]|jgi:AcrR family transcriptional regulator